MSYELVITRRFYQDLSGLDPQVQARILEALKRLKENPYLGRKVVAAATGEYRYRVGSYRIRYDIAGEKVYLLQVRHRREVYRG